MRFDHGLEASGLDFLDPPTPSHLFPMASAHTHLERIRKKRMIRSKPTGKAALCDASRPPNGSQRPAWQDASESPPARRWTPADAMPASGGWTARAGRWCGGRAASRAHGQSLRLCVRPLVAPASISPMRKIRSKPTRKASAARTARASHTRRPHARLVITPLSSSLRGMSLRRPGRRPPLLPPGIPTLSATARTCHRCKGHRRA